MTVPRTAVDATARPRARADVAAVTLDGETVIHDHGRIHVLDPVATLVWRCADGDATVDEIAADLASAFPAAPESVRRDVAGAIGTLTELGLMEDDDPAPAVPIDGFERLMDPPGSCVSCAERTWALRQGYRVGHRVAVVGTNSARADAVMRAALANHVVDLAATADDAEPPFFAVDVHDDPPAAFPHRLQLLHRGDTIAARSRRPDRIVRALVGHLASYGDLGALGLAAVNGLVVGRGDRAWIVSEPRDPLRFRRALAARGVLVADVPVALVDPATGEVVVGAPGLDVDVAAIDALAPESAGSEPDPLPWGRYRVAALGVDGTPSPTAALLALGPIAGDHRDHDETFGALLALLDAVPVRDAVDPDGIADGLGHG